MIIYNRIQPQAASAPTLGVLSTLGTSRYSQIDPSASGVPGTSEFCLCLSNLYCASVYVICLLSLLSLSVFVLSLLSHLDFIFYVARICVSFPFFLLLYLSLVRVCSIDGFLNLSLSFTCRSVNILGISATKH